MTLALARTMTDPKLTKQFKEDFDVAQKVIPRALAYAEADQVRADALRTMKSTKLAALEAGRRLKRMHDTESYADVYPTWDALCKTLKITPRDARYLMDLPDVTDSIEGTQLAKDIPSVRQTRELRKIHSDDRAAVVRHAESAGDTSAGSLKEWAQALGAKAREAGRTEAEAPRQKKERASGPMQRVKALISSALSVEMPEKAPPKLAEELREHLLQAQAVTEQISAALAPV